MLECEWVLRSVYRYSRPQVTRALRAFAGLERVSVESPAIVARALDLSAAGMDFADALHLTRAEHCTAFVTFDRKLIEAARTAGIATTRLP